MSGQSSTSKSILLHTILLPNETAHCQTLSINSSARFDKSFANLYFNATAGLMNTAFNQKPLCWKCQNDILDYGKSSVCISLSDQRSEIYWIFKKLSLSPFSILKSEWLIIIHNSSLGTRNVVSRNLLRVILGWR